MGSFLKGSKGIRAEDFRPLVAVVTGRIAASKNVAEGVHTPKELEFLASYGISADDAKLMAKMPTKFKNLKLNFRPNEKI